MEFTTKSLTLSISSGPGFAYIINAAVADEEMTVRFDESMKRSTDTSAGLTYWCLVGNKGIQSLHKPYIMDSNFPY